MDQSLLKKAALQSLVLMLTVMIFSYAIKQYNTVTLAAENHLEDSALKKITTQKVTTQNITDEALGAESNYFINNENTNNTEDSTKNPQELFSGIDPSILQKLGDTYFLLKKPQGDNLKLELKDLYINKSIQLTITGLTKDVFSSNMVYRMNGTDMFSGEPKFTEIVNKKVNGGRESEEVIAKDFGKDFCHGITFSSNQDLTSNLYTENILLKLDKVYAYTVYEDVNNYYIELRKPSEVYDKIVVIDAGHGGKDSGALSDNKEIYEKNINLAILLNLKKLLDKENIKVYYTRTEDDTVYLRPRVELADDVDCDYFISIHCNANAVSYPNGTEILYYDNKFKGVRALDLAKLFSREIGKAAYLKNRGVVKKHGDDIYIMDKAKVPMILIETGYLTNNSDINYLSKPENRKAIAQGIYNAIRKAYQEYPVKN
jgi:N-acetylmuramoyl-L-alanine amidase